jgi:hypothetical protein
MYADCSICMPVRLLCNVCLCAIFATTALDLGIVTDTSVNLQSAIEDALQR